jgi:hypothetical protein
MNDINKLTNYSATLEIVAKHENICNYTLTQ